MGAAVTTKVRSSVAAVTTPNVLPCGGFTVASRAPVNVSFTITSFQVIPLPCGIRAA
jgi:hypothetical protein